VNETGPYASDDCVTNSYCVGSGFQTVPFNGSDTLWTIAFDASCTSADLSTSEVLLVGGGYSVATDGTTTLETSFGWRFGLGSTSKSYEGTMFDVASPVESHLKFFVTGYSLGSQNYAQVNCQITHLKRYTM